MLKISKIAAFVLSINFVFAVYAPSAVSDDSYIYFSVFGENGSNNIGRVSLDGTGNPDEEFIVPGEAGWQDGQISIQGDYVYWVNNRNLYRNLKDGSGTKELIYTSDDPLSSVETDSNYIYWSDITNGSIGRAQLDGSNLITNFIATASPSARFTNDTYGIFVRDGFIYWANYESDTIGRALLNGTDVRSSFIAVPPASVETTSGPTGVWATSTHLYWANWNSGSIGRSNLDGTSIDNTFITELNNAYNVIGNGTYLYWTDFGAKKIGRANLDGSDPDLDFVVLSLMPVGIWVEVDGVVAPPSAPPAPKTPTALRQTSNLSFDQSQHGSDTLSDPDGQLRKTLDSINAKYGNLLR